MSCGRRPCLLIVWLCLCAPAALCGQDLVLNGGFERHRRCPKDWAQKPLARVDHVKVVQGAPGYYHACSDVMGVPSNWAGMAQAAEGQGYIGLVLTAHGGNECGSREFVQIELARPLENGLRYRLSFMVRMAQRSGYYTDRIGACFTDVDRSRKGVAGLIGRPHVQNAPDRFLADTSGWMRVEGVYNARGGERFVVLGNFQTCGQTTRKAMTSNKGDGVLDNMKARNILDLDPDQGRALRRRLLATQAYVYVDAVSLLPDPDQPMVDYLTPEQACPQDIGQAGDTDELIPDPRFLDNLPASRASWTNASGGTPDLMKGMTGIYLHSAMARDHREFIRTDLRTPLDPCGRYRLRMVVHRNPSYGYAVDRIGVALVDTFVMDRRRGLLPFDPVWSSPPGLVMEGHGAPIALCGEFQAPGCSRTLLIGNFHSDTATTVLVTDPSGGPFAYYFLDEVSLWRYGTVEGCMLTCAPKPVAMDDRSPEPYSLPPAPAVWEIHFDLAADLPKEAVSDIAEYVLGLLAVQPDVRVDLVGHTDASGTEELNQALSMRRALAVRNALIQFGVPATLFQLEAMGSSGPIADNATPEGRARNRRVEVSILVPKP